MTNDGIRQLLLSPDEQDVNEGTAQLWGEIGPSLSRLIQQLLPGSEYQFERLDLSKEIVVSLRANARLIAEADDARKRAVELALVEIAWYMRYLSEPDIGSRAAS